MIRELELDDAESCDAIVAGLPEWFGDETGIRDCAEAVRTQDGLVAEDEGAVVGFCTYEPRDPGCAEITWMAVRADRRRAGIGTSIVDALTDRLAARGVRLLLVKTLSDRDGRTCLTSRPGGSTSGWGSCGSPSSTSGDLTTPRSSS